MKRGDVILESEWLDVTSQPRAVNVHDIVKSWKINMKLGPVLYSVTPWRTSDCLREDLIRGKIQYGGTEVRIMIGALHPELVIRMCTDRFIWRNAWNAPPWPQGPKLSDIKSRSKLRLDPNPSSGPIISGTLLVLDTTEPTTQSRSWDQLELERL